MTERPIFTATQLEDLCRAVASVEVIPPFHRSTPAKRAAAQLAFEAALAPLVAEGVTAGVTVGNDATHGTLATVSIAAVPTLHRDRVAARCAELLGGFQIRHSIQFTT